MPKDDDDDDGLLGGERRRRGFATVGNERDRKRLVYVSSRVL